jgi:hypothetical protein
MRSVVLLGALACLAAVTWGASRTLARIADEREASSGPLLRKKAVGPPRRWAMWMATLSTACVASYLLNEHRPAAPTLADLLPARVLDVIVVAVGVGLLRPYIGDLSAGRRTRTWPWSGAVPSGRDIRDDDDVIGAISRMSPPLLFAMSLGLMMFIATYIVGMYEPSKLLGGFGVLGLFGAGLLAAPALLRAQGESIEPAWRSRWYQAQRSAVARLRVFVVCTHRIVVVAQVAVLGVDTTLDHQAVQLNPGETRERQLVGARQLARDRLDLGDLFRGENDAVGPTALDPQAHPIAHSRTGIFAGQHCQASNPAGPRYQCPAPPPPRTRSSSPAAPSGTAT